MSKEQQVKEQIRATYGARVLSLKQEQKSGCCSPGLSCDSISSNLYDISQQSAVPEEALLASLGCGNPFELARLKPGEVVLDLGSGGGIDVFLSAGQVGPAGKVYGLDMTDEMLALARSNQRKTDIENVEFLKGEMEDIPLPDESVDVVISNCVINLSINKDLVFKEIFRILKPGGRMSVSDIVWRGPMPEAFRSSVELWVGCVAGALQEAEYDEKLTAAGFKEIVIEPTRIYEIDDAREFLTNQGIAVDEIASIMDERLMSAWIRARKPITS